MVKKATYNTLHFRFTEKLFHYESHAFKRHPASVPEEWSG